VATVHAILAAGRFGVTVLLTPLGAAADGQHSLAAPAPELVAPGLVSTKQGEYSPSYHAGRSELYFMRRTPGRFDYTLYVARDENGTWSTPEVLPFSGLTRDDAPFIAPDGETLYFDSRRPAEGLRRGSINLWRVERQGDGWGDPEALRSASSEPDRADAAGADEFGPVVTSDGTLWFYSFRPPHREGRHYRAAPPDYETVVVDAELPDPSAPTFVGYLTLSPDGRTVVLEGRAGGRDRRDSDLYFACLDDQGRWGDVKPLAQLNTPWNEGGPALGTDGASLWFSSDRPSGDREAGDANLWRVDTQVLPVPCFD
jgi:hypothetical protein